MSAPRFVDCKCGHGKPDHERDGFAPQCTAASCSCLQYRATTAPDRPVAVASPPATTEQIIAAARRSKSKRVLGKADKIETLVAELRGLLVGERKAAEAKRAQEAGREAARADVERLQRELAAAKAKLTGRAPAVKVDRPIGDGKCPDCGQTGLTNVGVHRFRKHGYRAGDAA